MGDSFLAYLQQLELIAFFSGYALLYAFVYMVTGLRQKKNNFWSNSAALLPYAYALVGSLYLGLQLRNLYPDYSMEHLRYTIQQPWLIGWALLSLLFWIPTISRRTVLSVLHSLVFFYFVAKEIFLQLSTSGMDKDSLRNDMRIYTISLLLNLGAYISILLVAFLFSLRKKG